jgi:site-specific DNA-cytosine methylase
MLWYTKSRRAQTNEDYETWLEGGVMPTLNAFDNGDVRTTVLIATADVIGSLQARDYKGVGNQYVAENKLIISYPIQGTMIGRSDTAGPQGKGYGEVNDPMFTIDTVSGHGVAISFDTQFGSNATTFEDMSPTLKASQQPPSVTGTLVRRLTPVECERLQGFPDDWTAGQSDSQRYKQMGNAVAVPVVEWLIGNICDTF